jgi:hypothetical protein
MDIFIEVLEPLVFVLILVATYLIVNIDDEDSLVESWLRRILDCE